MEQNLQQAYIVAATRTPLGKAPRGMLSATRPDDLLATALRGLMAQAPQLDPALFPRARRASTWPVSAYCFPACPIPWAA